ncbi:DUF3108 domain-containing protein [Hymenobacter volaticus]|uniref:DUF3108 domain-containing protein n=1 Tax=Hymenobacter volaticus TaxID=2932254 RepID=A0ABY4GEJ1_9BACT|nr:hypothetical protein [Hymenobacter volaticus]UOQ69215.1 hypothetical protein MUN86_27565 [Hymenobacter volaticus]
MPLLPTIARPLPSPFACLIASRPARLLAGRQHRASYGWVLGAWLLAYSAAAQTPDTLRVGDRRLQVSRLQPGTRQYLVYFQNPAQPKMLGFWLWRRQVQATRHQGAPVLRITQHWYGADTISYREVTSLVRAGDFASLYHAETVKGQLKAYNWNSTGIAGADSVAGNQANAFQQPFQQPAFNWNLDIETFELLPLAAGKRFVIPFYDAGGKPPTYVTYTVTGAETLAVPGGPPVACWKLVTAGLTPTKAPFKQTFWISQRDHEFLKEEDQYPGGLSRYKIKTSTVPGVMPNPVSRPAK